MGRIIFIALMMASGSAFAIDPLCTTTANLSIRRCPQNSIDWYDSYTDIVDRLDGVSRTAVSTFTVPSDLGVGGNIEAGIGKKFTTVAGNDLNIDTPAARSIFFKVGGTTYITMDNTGRLGVGASPGSNANLYSKSGTSTDNFAPSGFEYSTIASTNTIADTNEKVLYTYAIPANVLKNNGDCLQFACGLAGAATATTKRARIRFNTTTSSSLDGTILADTGAVTTNGVLMHVKTTICRSGSDTQVVRDAIAIAAGTVGTQITTPSLTATDTGAINASCTCQNGTANSGDCVGNVFTIEKFPAP